MTAQPNLVFLGDDPANPRRPVMVAILDVCLMQEKFVWPKAGSPERLEQLHEGRTEGGPDMAGKADTALQALRMAY